MYPEVQLPSPNGFLGHTRGQVNCAMARSKALINAGVPVYLVGTESCTSQMARPNPLDLKVCPTPVCHGISVDDCAKFENLYTPYEAVRGPPRCPVLEPLRMRARSSNRFVWGMQGPVSLTIGDQNAIKSCRWSSDFYLSAVLTQCRALSARRVALKIITGNGPKT